MSCVSSSIFFTCKNNWRHCIKTFKYSYMFLSNSAEFSVILQCTMTQYHICCMFSRLSCEFRSWEPETERIYCHSKLLLPWWFASQGIAYGPERRDTSVQQRTQQYKIIARPLELSSSLFCVTQSVMSPQPFLPICPSWHSDLCMYTYAKFFPSAFTYPAMHVVLH